MQLWPRCSALPSLLDSSHSLLPLASQPLTAPLPDSGIISKQGSTPVLRPVKALPQKVRAFPKQPTSHCREEKMEALQGGMVPPLTVLSEGIQQSQGPGMQEGREEGTPSVHQSRPRTEQMCLVPSQERSQVLFILIQSRALNGVGGRGGHSLPSPALQSPMQPAVASNSWIHTPGCTVPRPLPGWAVGEQGEGLDPDSCWGGQCSSS